MKAFTHKYKAPASAVRQSGYTLIELLISISLGLAMMSVAMQYLVGSSASFNATESASRIQENGRFALSMITDELRMAGYGDPNNGPRPGYFYTTACGAFNPCTANGANTDPDRIAVWYDPPADDGTETDCTGSALGASAQVANLFYLDTSAEGVSSLMCRGFDLSTNDWNASAQPLIDGVDNMQILYGIDNGGTFSYISADAMTAANWGAIASVRLVLLVSTGLEDGSSGQDTRTYELVDTPEISIDDAFNRRVFSTTVVINNATI
jgi:prepilin-type N-terminal cleavage/methylation domain-containing protein